ncbi:Gm10277 [Phodopus roborovskii]|uniref:Gm10277 protein n=1 Tax=Phodopus roborovskii TaxID=109678 RepID=A0AAU9YZQ3_PHORO|nr:Gm10277 [Phodopus roborovskii]
MRSGDKGHRGCKGQQERNQILGCLGGPCGPENPVLVGRPHLRMESEAAPFLFHDQPPLSAGLPGLPFPLLSPTAPEAKRGRHVYICHHSETQEYSLSHWPRAPAAASGGLSTHVGAVLRLQLEFVAETGKEPYHEPSQPSDIPAQRLPREKQQEGRGNRGTQATFQPLRDLQTGAFHQGLLDRTL